jgi:hypothetical protein
MRSRPAEPRRVHSIEPNRKDRSEGDKRVKRIAAVAAIGATITAAGLSTMCSAAAATRATVVCQYSGAVSETPPGGVSPFSFQSSGTLSGCQSASAGSPASATISGPSGTVANCLAGTVSAAATVTWSDGQTSSIQFSFTVVAGNLVGTGAVTAGFDAGGTAVLPFSVPCSAGAGGATSGTSSSVFGITPPVA